MVDLIKGAGAQNSEDIRVSDEKAVETAETGRRCSVLFVLHATKHAKSPFARLEINRYIVKIVLRRVKTLRHLLRDPARRKVHSSEDEKGALKLRIRRLLWPETAIRIKNIRKNTE